MNSGGSSHTEGEKMQITMSCDSQNWFDQIQKREGVGWRRGEEERERGKEGECGEVVMTSFFFLWAFFSRALRGRLQQHSTVTGKWISLKQKTLKMSTY